MISTLCPSTVCFVPQQIEIFHYIAARDDFSMGIAAAGDRVAVEIMEHSSESFKTPIIVI